MCGPAFSPVVAFGAYRCRRPSCRDLNHRQRLALHAIHRDWLGGREPRRRHFEAANARPRRPYRPIFWNRHTRDRASVLEIRPPRAGAPVKDQPVTVHCDKKSHDREVCHVLMGRMDIGLEMVKLGMAWYAFQYAAELSPSARQAYAQAERDAKEGRLGFWAEPAPVPPWECRKLRKAESGKSAGSPIIVWRRPWEYVNLLVSRQLSKEQQWQRLPLHQSRHASRHIDTTAATYQKLSKRLRRLGRCQEDADTNSI